ncbi:hypothetical protein [Verrucosispora sp. WMMD573]|uniref:hypothetical protein n=1 Tax=Verrucosispora sp. WMMD573 TaxID=3015149 RepID=UPI00248AEF84|nr:hypothetical protein [Verrucosispora sp. WMMD573]WBB57656.1 hypothetical protein O7601_11500 [Verrucosispora sp. WMMD573]
MTSLRRSLPALAAAVGILLTAACGLNSSSSSSAGGQRSSAAPLSTSSALTGVQSPHDFAPGVEEQIGEALIGPDLDVVDVRSVPLESPYADDVLSPVCGNRPGGGVYLSAFGQRRQWTGPDLEIEQFSGAWGVIPAAEAVAQVRGKLGCGTYREREGPHRVLGERHLPKLAGLDGQLMFCEVVDEDGPERPTYICTALLARDGVATRIQARATGADQAEQLVGELSVQAARALTAEP